MNVTPIKTRVFREGEDLSAFIGQHIHAVPERTVLAVTSKIVALAEKRTADAAEEARVIREESEWQRETKYGSLTLKDGLYMWNAGIDSSNADGRIVLLPNDSFAAAGALRTTLAAYFNVRELGIVITDSRIMPLRAGVVGIALGYAGFRGLRDYRGNPDIFGRRLKYTQTDIADNLASAAVLTMGEGSEQQPLCVITDAPIEFAGTVDSQELRVPPDEDMYGPLFR